MRYRIVAHQDLYRWIKLQEKRWYGWKTVGKFLAEFDGINRAKQYQKELEQLNKKG